MLKEIVFTYPGLGNQKAGMGKRLYDQSLAARQVFEEASEALNFNVATLCFENPQEKLGLTEYAQPAVVTLSIAADKHLREELQIVPGQVFGHSVGEISAATAAGCMDFVSAVKLARIRGKAMQEVGTGSMAAVLKLQLPQVEAICKEISREGVVVEVANENAQDQTVISGNREAVEAAIKIIEEAGGRAIILKGINVPSHSSLMEPVRKKLEEILQSIQIQVPQIPLIANLSAQYLTSAEEIRASLANQISGRIRFLSDVRLAIANGGRRFYEVGPGNALSGLVKRIDSSIETVTLDL